MSEYPYSVLTQADTPRNKQTGICEAMAWGLNTFKKSSTDRSRFQVGITESALLEFTFRSVDDAVLFKLRWGIE